MSEPRRRTRGSGSRWARHSNELGGSSTSAAEGPRSGRASTTSAGGLHGGKYPCFDGLRALAALAIVVFHAVANTSQFQGTGGTFFLDLDIGVWVFFVISGFLLYRPFAAFHFGTAPPVDLRVYFLRRFTRIYPAYWLALAFFTLIVTRAVGIEGAREWVTHVTLTQTYAHDQVVTGITVAWSLVAEVSFYVFLPVFSAAVAWLGRRRTPLMAEFVGLACVFGVGLATVAAYTYGRVPQVALAFPIYLHLFGCGMLLATLTSRSWSIRIPPWLAQITGAALPWWALAVTALLALEPLRDAAPSRLAGIAASLCVAFAALCFVVPAVLGVQDRGLLRCALRSRPLVFLGIVSYGIYLWHPLTLLAIRDDWLGWRQGAGSPFGLLAVSLPVIVAAATVSWFLLEQPLLRRAHRYRP